MISVNPQWIKWKESTEINQGLLATRKPMRLRSTMGNS